MLRNLAAAMVAAVTLTVVSGLHDPASAGSLDGFSAGGSGYTYGLGHQSGATGSSGAASRSGALGTPSGAGYAGTGHRYDLGGRQGSGWCAALAATSIPAGATASAPNWAVRAAEPIHPCG
jgi:hypothetical protein